METPGWIQSYFDRVFPGVRVKWEKYPNRTRVLPIEGYSFDRRKDAFGWTVRHRYMPQSGKPQGWLIIDTNRVSDGRFVIRDEAEQDGYGNAQKIFDCVGDEGQLIQPSQFWIRKVHERHDAWERLFQEIEEEKEKRKKAMAYEAEQAAMEPMLELGSAIAKIPRVSLENTPPCFEEKQTYQDKVLARYVANELPQVISGL